MHRRPHPNQWRTTCSADELKRAEALIKAGRQ